MSFWSDLGERAKDGIVGAWDATRTARADAGFLLKSVISPGDQMAQYLPQPVQDVRNAGNKAFYDSVTWAGNQASHGVASTFAAYDLVDQQGGDPISRLGTTFNADTWKRAWDMSSGTTGGSVMAYLGKQYATGGIGDKPLFDTAAASPTQVPDFAEFNKSTAGRLSGGAADIALTWYADPTIALGKVAKMARAANAVEDAAKADEIAKAFDARGLAANPVTKQATLRGPGALFSKSADESASRFSALVASSDNMDVNRLAAHYAPLLTRHPNSAPIVDLLGQASGIEDIATQRLVKGDILLSAMGSDIARQRLIEHAPALARATQRASFAPEEFAVFDALSANADQLYRNGGSITDAARRLATTGNTAEIEAYGERLDQIHRHMRDIGNAVDQGAALEKAGLTTLDRAKQAWKAQVDHQFFYQDAASGRTIRLLHWSANQRFRGTIATDDTALGHSQLLDHLTRSKLFTDAERQDWSQRWYAANGQNVRNKVVDNLWDEFTKKIAAKYDMSTDEVDGIIKDMQMARGDAAGYTTQLMEQARADGLNRITIEDPASGMPTSIDSALYESHLRNNVPLPPSDLIERVIRHRQDGGTLSDLATTAGQKAIGSVEGLNDVWRLFVLARPGLFFRTQLDTQLRVAAQIGATQYVKQAAVGLGHMLNKRLSSDELVQVAMRAEDHMALEDAMAQAANLRRLAETTPGEAGNNLIDRATQIESQAENLRTRLADPNRLGTMPKQVKIAGQKVTMDPAYSDDADRIATWRAMLPGDATLSDAMTVIGDKIKAKFIEDGGHKTHMPNDATWSAGYVRAMDPMLGSYAGRKILENLNMPTPDLVSMLRNDDQARKSWLAVHFDNEGGGKVGDSGYFNWIDRAVANAKYMVPNETIRKRVLSGQRLTPEDVQGLFKPRGAASAQQIAEMQRPYEDALKKAQDKLTAFEEVTPLQTKAQREMHAALQAKVTDAQSKLDEFKTTLPKESASELADRMPVEGPAFSMFDGPGSRHAAQNPVLDVARKAVQLFSDMPDTVLGRHPMYVARYEKHWKMLATREVNRTGELTPEAQATINKMAKHRAIQDVQQTMFDTARYTGAHHGVMRVVSPFLNAWEDALVSWSRMMYDDPKILGGLLKTWNAPERLGAITDENGNIVRPGQSAKQKFITVPVPGFFRGWMGVKDVKFSKDALNSVFQGQVPWLPGFGPVVALPSSEVVARSWPELGDPNGPVPKPLQPFMRSLLNGDSPKYNPGVRGFAQDAATAMTPSWVNRMIDAFDNTSPAYTNVVQDSLNSQIIEARQAGKPIDINKFTDKAMSAARNTTIFRALAMGIFGASTQGAGTQEFYANQYRALQQQSAQFHAEGKTVEQVFNERFPEAANLRFSVSVNNTGIQAFLKTEDRAKKYAKQIALNPTYGWFYVGSDNIANGVKDEFSPSIYNAQSSRQLAPGSEHRQRDHVDPALMRDETEKSLGWGQYQQFMTRVDLIAEKEGLTNPSDDPRLAAVKDEFLSRLKAQYPVWGADFDSFDKGKLDRFVTNVAEPALQDPSLKNRSDIKLLGQYLQLRQRAEDIAKQRGITLAAGDASDLRAVLNRAGAMMARQDMGFEQTWQRVLSREVDR